MKKLIIGVIVSAMILTCGLIGNFRNGSAKEEEPQNTKVVVANVPAGDIPLM